MTPIIRQVVTTARRGCPVDLPKPWTRRLSGAPSRSWGADAGLRFRFTIVADDADFADAIDRIVARDSGTLAAACRNSETNAPFMSRVEFSSLAPKHRAMVSARPSGGEADRTNVNQLGSLSSMFTGSAIPKNRWAAVPMRFSHARSRLEHRGRPRRRRGIIALRCVTAFPRSAVPVATQHAIATARKLLKLSEGATSTARLSKGIRSVISQVLPGDARMSVTARQDGVKRGRWVLVAAGFNRAMAYGHGLRASGDRAQTASLRRRDAPT